MKKNKSTNLLKTLGNFIAHMPKQMYFVVIAALLLLVIGIGMAVVRNTATNETLDLSEYYNVTQENEMVPVVNGMYEEKTTDNADGIYENDKAYLRLDYAKRIIDSGYVYDKTEGVLRYVTDSNIITANVDSATYSVDKNNKSMDAPIVIRNNGEYYILVDFMSQYTDMQYEVYENPSRIVVETAGYEKKVATVKRDTQVRKNGGVKSKILTTVNKKDQVSVLQNYGKWSQVVTKDGVVGYIKNNKLKKVETVTVEATLPERKYNHMLSDEKIVLAWHQVTNSDANANVESVLEGTTVNVVSPTWFYMDDNQGGIADRASSSYVDYCHSKNIKVWGLVSNFENKNIDTATVLNVTSARDALVNNLIAAAITYNLDGINVDIETLPESAVDGYIEFIKELSVKCENNNLVLSVDLGTMGYSYGNYSPEVLPNYVDYGVIMAYDEHTIGDEAGSVSSITFVKDSVKSCMNTFPKEQIILGLPFYTRLWTQTATETTPTSYSMEKIQAFIQDHNGNVVWDDATGQNYSEIVDGETTYKVWLEDANSLSLKIEVAKNEELAGIAFWKLTQEVPTIWQTIATYTK